MNRQSIHGKSSQQGVVIVEAMIAILLFSMGVLAIIGLQAAMVKNTGDSKTRAESANVAQQCIGELWSTPGAVVCPNATANAAALLPNGALAIAAIPVPAIAGAGGGFNFTITITWLQPGEPVGTTPHNFTAMASVVGN